MQSSQQELTVTKILQILDQQINPNESTKEEKSDADSPSLSHIDLNSEKKEPTTGKVAELSPEVYEFWKDIFGLTSLNEKQIKSKKFINTIAMILKLTGHPFFSNIIAQSLGPDDKVVHSLINKVHESLDDQVLFNLIASLTQLIVEQRRHHADANIAQNNTNNLIEFYNKKNKDTQELTRKLTESSFYLTRLTCLKDLLDTLFVFKDEYSQNESKTLPESLNKMLIASELYKRKIGFQTELGNQMLMQSVVKVCFAIFLSVNKIAREELNLEGDKEDDIEYQINLTNGRQETLLMKHKAAVMFYQILNQVFLGSSILASQGIFQKNISVSNKSKILRSIVDNCFSDDMLRASLMKIVSKKQFAFLPLFDYLSHLEKFINQSSLENYFKKISKEVINADRMAIQKILDAHPDSLLNEHEIELKKKIADNLQELEYDNFDQKIAGIKEIIDDFAVNAQHQKYTTKLFDHENFKNLARFITKVSVRPTITDVAVIINYIENKKIDLVASISDKEIGKILVAELKDIDLVLNTKEIKLISKCLSMKDFKKLDKISDKASRKAIQNAFGKAYPGLADQNDISKAIQALIHFSPEKLHSIKDEEFKNLLDKFLATLINNLKDNIKSKVKLPTSLKLILFLVNFMPGSKLLTEFSAETKDYSSEDFRLLTKGLAELSADSLVDNIDTFMNSGYLKKHHKYRNFLTKALKDTGSSLCTDLLDFMGQPSFMLNTINVLGGTVNSQIDLSLWKKFDQEVGELVSSKNPLSTFFSLWENHLFQKVWLEFVTYEERWEKIISYIERIKALVNYGDNKKIELEQINKYVKGLKKVLEVPIRIGEDKSKIQKIQDHLKNLKTLEPDTSLQEYKNLSKALKKAAKDLVSNTEIDPLLVIIQLFRDFSGLKEQNLSDFVHKSTSFLILNLAGPTAIAMKYYGNKETIDFSIKAAKDSFQKYCRIMADLAVNSMNSNLELDPFFFYSILKEGINAVTHIELRKFDPYEKDYQALVESCTFKTRSRSNSEEHILMQNTISSVPDVVVRAQDTIVFVQRMFDTLFKNPEGLKKFTELSVLHQLQHLHLMLSLAFFIKNVELSYQVIGNLLRGLIVEKKYTVIQIYTVVETVFEKSPMIGLSINVLKTMIKKDDRDEIAAMLGQLDFFDILILTTKGFNPLYYGFLNTIKQSTLEFIIEQYAKKRFLFPLLDALRDKDIMNDKGYKKKIKKIFKEHNILGTEFKFTTNPVADAFLPAAVFSKMIKGDIAVDKSVIRKTMDVNSKDVFKYFDNNIFNCPISNMETIYASKKNQNNIIHICKIMISVDKEFFNNKFSSEWQRFCTDNQENYPEWCQRIEKELIAYGKRRLSSFGSSDDGSDNNVPNKIGKSKDDRFKFRGSYFGNAFYNPTKLLDNIFKGEIAVGYLRNVIKLIKSESDKNSVFETFKKYLEIVKNEAKHNSDKKERKIESKSLEILKSLRDLATKSNDSNAGIILGLLHHEIQKNKIQYPKELVEFSEKQLKDSKAEEVEHKSALNL